MLALGFFGASAIPMAARAAEFPRAGVICDAPRQVCFDRKGPSIGLTRTYYGPGASNRPPTTGPAMGTAPAPQPPPAGERQCQLMQRGLTVFSGPCRLYRQNETVWKYYVVQMDNGKLYRFQRRASQLVLSDATGTWPVFIADRGSAVQFRWSNLLLDVSRSQQARGGGPDGVVPPTPTPRSTGEAGQDLLDDIFP